MKKSILLITTILGGLFANAQNPYPIISTDTVQFVNPTRLAIPTTSSNAGTITQPDYVYPTFKDTIFRDTVRIEGIVVFNPRAYGLSTGRKAAFLQRKGGGPWSGVQIMCEPTGTGTTLATLLSETKFYDNFVVGYKVRITGVVREFSQGETQINLIRSNANWENGVEQLSLTPDTLVYNEITADKLMLGNINSKIVQQKLTGEALEGTLVRLRNVTVYENSVSGNRTTWSVIDDNGNVIDIRDLSAYYRRDANGDSTGLNVVDPNRFTAPPIGTRLEYIQGIVTELQATGINRYFIAPLYPGDYKICTTCPPSIKFISRNPTVVKSSDTTRLTFEITVNDTTIATSKLYFKTSINNVLDSVTLTAVPSFPNQYRATIPPINSEGVFTYWVGATDNKNRSSVVPDPFNVGSKFYITGPNGVDNIRTLQKSVVPNGTTVWNGDSLLNINVRGIVTGKGFGNLITVQDGTGPNSAIFVNRNSGADSTGKWNVGDSVLITRATVRESFNITILSNILSEVIATGKALPAVQLGLSLDSFSLGNTTYGRKWEAVLMRFDSIEISSKNPDAPTGSFGEFAVKGKTANSLRVDDLNANFKNNYNNLVYVGMKMNFIQGPMYFGNGNFKIVPRNVADVDFSNIDTIKPIITVIGGFNVTVKKDSVYTDLGATATDDKDGNITANIRKTGSVNTAVVGVYNISYAVNDRGGNSDSVVRIVTVVANDITNPVITLLGKNPDTLQRTTTYNDPGATALDDRDGNITSKITKVSSIDSSKTGTYTITYTVKDLAGNTGTAVRTVIVINKVGVNEVNTIANSVKVYPSPAYAELNVSIENINQLPAQLEIIDMLGRVITKQTINTKNFNEQLNIGQLNNGVYFLNISNANGMQTIKFMVSGK